MEERNQHALALAFKRARAKSRKIKELGLQPNMSEKSINTIIKALAEAKAEKDGTDFKDEVKGQRWYVEDLLEFAKLKTAQERLDREYDNSICEVAGEDEMLSLLEEEI